MLAPRGADDDAPRRPLRRHRRRQLRGRNMLHRPPRRGRLGGAGRRARPLSPRARDARPRCATRRSSPPGTASPSPGLAVAGRVLERAALRAAAPRAATFVLARCARRAPRAQLEGRTHRRGGFLDDHAFLTAGCWTSTRRPSIAAGWRRRWRWPRRRSAGSPTRRWLVHDRRRSRGADRARKARLRRRRTVGDSVALLSAMRLSTLTTDDRWRAVADRALASLAPA